MSGTYQQGKNWTASGGTFTNGHGATISNPTAYFGAVAANTHGYNSGYANGHGTPIAAPAQYYAAVGERGGRGRGVPSRLDDTELSAAPPPRAQPLIAMATQARAAAASDLVRAATPPQVGRSPCTLARISSGHRSRTRPGTGTCDNVIELHLACHARARMAVLSTAAWARATRGMPRAPPRHAP